MITDPSGTATPSSPPALAGPRWALVPVTGSGIASAAVARMLDPDGIGAAVVLASGAQLPYRSQPVLLADTTVYAAAMVESLIRGWHYAVPKPWLVLIADVPAAAPPATRYRIRALASRLAGIAQVPYLPSLRTVESGEAALEHKEVINAALKLRRQLERK